MTTADLIPVIRELSRAEKLEIIEFLRSELEKEELQSILKPGASYPLTQYGRRMIAIKPLEFSKKC